MSLRALGSKVNIPYLYRVEYITRSDGRVALKVNHSVFVGIYNDIDDAKEVVKGILTKLGCNEPDERILTVPTVGDVVAPPPAPLDWSDTTGGVFALQPNNVLQVPDGLNATVTYTNTGIFTGASVKVSNSTFASNDYITNTVDWVAFASGDTVTATAGQYVGFTAQFSFSEGTEVFTITDNSTLAVIDTFNAVATF